MKTATTILLLAFTLIAVPHMAFASTLCAKQSKIKTMKLYNSESRIGLSFPSYPAPRSAYRDGKYLDIWESDSYARWSEKYNILRLAFVMDATVDIYSSDHDCQGPQDEFTIELSLQ